MKEPLLTATGIHKTYEKNVRVLEDLDLEILPNTAYAIIGSSGEGKTTLLHLLAGLDKPDHGDIETAGRIGLVFQSYNLLEDLTVLENLEVPFKIARKRITRERLEKIHSLIEEVGLEDKTHTLACKLSGGEKQRVAIARAFVLDPPLILADEPTGNLDNLNSEKVHQLLFNFVKNKEKSLIIATHDQHLASLCDKKYLLKDGLLMEIGIF